MSGRPLNDMTADELAEIVHIAKQEYDSLTKRLGITSIGWQDNVISYLAITVAVQATLVKRQADESYARPWYKRWIP